MNAQDAPTTERGVAMIAVLATIMIVTTIGFALVGVMDTDVLHASIQNAVARSFYLAQAGLEEAKGEIAAAVDPRAYTTPARGVTRPYGGGRFTYWVDAGPATGCGAGFKTLEALAEVPFLKRAIPARVRACAIAGTPMAIALFGVSRIELGGSATRIYLAGYGTDTPGGGGSLGSFTETHFADTGVHLNALSEEAMQMVRLRDAGSVPDYALFGFPARPAYDPDPAADGSPWILGVFGDLVKARPETGTLLNACGTVAACVSARDSHADLESVATLRGTVESMARDAAGMRHVYMRRMREQQLPQLALDRAPFLESAKRNAANVMVNKHAGFPDKTDSVYSNLDFYQLVGYLSTHRGEGLQGTVYVAGIVQVVRDLDLGGPNGDVTLAIAGDLILGEDVSLTNRHDLTTAAGRATPGVVVLGLPTPAGRLTTVCGGQTIRGSGRLVLCGGSLQRLITDGLLYTADGMTIGPGAAVDQIGAMYHNNRGTPNSSFTVEDATVVLRFDPLALSAFGRGLTILSWQQLK